MDGVCVLEGCEFLVFGCGGEHENGSMFVCASRTSEAVEHIAPMIMIVAMR